MTERGDDMVAIGALEGRSLAGPLALVPLRSRRKSELVGDDANSKMQELSLLWIVAVFGKAVIPLTTQMRT